MHKALLLTLGWPSIITAQLVKTPFGALSINLQSPIHTQVLLFDGLPAIACSVGSHYRLLLSTNAMAIHQADQTLYDASIQPLDDQTTDYTYHCQLSEVSHTLTFGLLY